MKSKKRKNEKINECKKRKEEINDRQKGIEKKYMNEVLKENQRQRKQKRNQR